MGETTDKAAFVSTWVLGDVIFPIKHIDYPLGILKYIENAGLALRGHC
jgi:hypothetical protein